MIQESFYFTENKNSVYFRCVEDCTESVMITDHKGVLQYVNPAWSRFYGYSKEEAIGSTPKILHSGKHDPLFYQKMWKDIASEERGSWRGEVINKRKDGTVVPVLLTITPFRNDRSVLVGYLGIGVDLTDKKQLEAEIRQQDRLASIGFLASGLAHEIGTPLGVIRGRAEMLASENLASPSSIEVIISQIDRISRLMDSLLRFSREPQKKDLTPVSIKETLNGVLFFLEERLRKRNIQAILTVPDPLKILGEPGGLQQIFINLCINAYQAIEKEIKRGRNGPHSIRISAKEIPPWTEILVEDSGCGIAPQEKDRIFEAFYTTKDVGEGTGLGLTIVSKLVHEMGGKIHVESESQKGTTFHLKFKRP